MPPLDPQSLYVQFGRLIQTKPPLRAPLTPDYYEWAGRASALIAATGDLVDKVAIDAAITALNCSFGTSEHDLLVVLYRALGKAELEAPVSAQGAFIPAGAVFDTFAAIGKVLSEAQAEVLIVDPYLDETVFEFVPSAPERVLLRLLAAQGKHKPNFPPAVRRWLTQNATKWPIEARLAARDELHDRLIIVDGKTVWDLTQSLNHFAKRSPASIIRVYEDDIIAEKITTYHARWMAATPLT